MSLEELYKAAEDDNVFFVEYAGMPAAAGDLRDLEALAELEKTSPEELHQRLTSSFLGALVDLCVLGDVSGNDRVANCQSAWDNLVRYRAQGYYPKVISVREQLGLPAGEAKQLGTF